MSRQIRWGRVRDHLIGVFVAAHIAVVLVTGACTAPDGSRNSDRVILDRFAGDDPDLRAFIVRHSAAFNAFQKRAVAFVEPYRKCCDVRQRWTMFTGTSRWTRRLEIEVRIDGEWKKIWRQGTDHDPLYRFYRFNQYLRRARRGKDRGNWKRFSAFAARRALEQHPEADRARIRVWSGKIPKPQAGHKKTRFHKLEKNRVIKR